LLQQYLYWGVTSGEKFGGSRGVDGGLGSPLKILKV